jgi:gas vesicle protein
MGLFMMGFFLGAVVGAATSMIFAPQSGRALQDNLRQRANEIMAEGRRAAVERRAELEAQFAQSKSPARGPSGLA